MAIPTVFTRALRQRKSLGSFQSRTTLPSRNSIIERNVQTYVDCRMVSCGHRFSSLAQERELFKLKSRCVQFSSKSEDNGSFREHDLSSPDCNVPLNIVNRIGENLHLQKNHPLNTIKCIIENYWQNREPKVFFETKDDLDPVVSVDDNFDSLLIKPDHVSRSKSDTYYLKKDTVLRTHTSAHQTTLMKSGHDRFLVTGDVYRCVVVYEPEKLHHFFIALNFLVPRRDEIDSSHYPIFHQMEGVRMFTESELNDVGAHSLSDQVAFVENDLKEGLEGLVRELFGEVEMRWGEDYFPFTDPSFELEIHFNGDWLEVLGCGIVHKEIVKAVNRGDQIGWAFGLGLERLAMILFSIPDIRLFWSKDERFHNQFEEGKIVTFVPYSKYPPCLKDVSFWTHEEGVKSTFHPNDFNEVIRDVAGDLVEKAELIDEFIHPKTHRQSNCFRISYRSMDKSLTNEEIDALQEKVRREIVMKLGVELR